MPPYVEFTYAGASPATLTANNPDFAEVVWLLDLYDVGPSVGENLQRDGLDGTLARDRKIGELPAVVKWEIRGVEDINGTAAADKYRQLRLNIRALQDWFTAAPGMNLTVTLVDGAASWSGNAQHEEFGQKEWHGLYVAREQLLTIDAGSLVAV